MTREVLSTEKYWEKYWGFKQREYSARLVEYDFLRGSAQWAASMVGPWRYAFENYHDYILWNVIYKKFMPKGSFKVLEIGSAPGYHLVRLYKTFGCIPYGVECSARGVEINKSVFKRYGINPDNVIHDDFFSDRFQKEYKDYFNVIISRGFIEDFGDSDAGYVVEKHKDLLRPGGILFAIIPNFRGINYLGLSLFSKELLSEVNFNIMKKENFIKIFDERRWNVLYCGYYGTFNCGDRFSPRQDFLMKFVLMFCNGMQKALNVIFRVLLKDKGAETSIFSPYLVFVGTKRQP
ncbi:MAG: class I SAM-dependent methyltransferase [Candidatus Omnitrophica bacterium]|nr:class I SAM-dependent methyltransferase [Candidatus Omnitrophota bacterium]MCM8790576.1 class I SAM-dependent methyltransferase [Candidatus Omnitrophota bacterium]